MIPNAKGDSSEEQNTPASVTQVAHDVALCTNPLIEHSEVENRHVLDQGG